MYMAENKWVTGSPSWWLNPTLWKNMCKSNWIVSPQIGVKITNIGNHHLETGKFFQSNLLEEFQTGQIG